MSTALLAWCTTKQKNRNFVPFLRHSHAPLRALDYSLTLSGVLGGSFNKSQLMPTVASSITIHMHGAKKK